MKNVVLHKNAAQAQAGPTRHYDPREELFPSKRIAGAELTQVSSVSATPAPLSPKLAKTLVTKKLVKR